MNGRYENGALPEKVRLLYEAVLAMVTDGWDINRMKVSDIIGAKQAGFGKAVQIVSALSAQKDAATAADAEKPDLVIQNLLDMIPWLDQINPDMHIDEAQQSSGMFVPFF